MVITEARRIFAEEVSGLVHEEVRLKGWVYHLRILGKTAFIILRDCTGEAQCVIASDALKQHKLKVEDVVEISGAVRAEPRAKTGCEVDISEVHVLNRAGQTLPFQSVANVEAVGLDTLLQYRPLSLRTEAVGDIFRIQAAVLAAFRDALNRRRFTEIVTSKIVSGGTEGGSNLFEIKYFDRVAYLAQSPQFYKEHGVAGLERVYETAHVYRAEPHASSRHLTEYYSLDVEFGFIDGPEDVIQFERELLTDMFENLNSKYGEVIRKYRTDLLPSMLEVPRLGVRRLSGDSARRVRTH
jgi:nondiscriminating aspartyl-tRNA synthetase